MRGRWLKLPVLFRISLGWPKKIELNTEIFNLSPLEDFELFRITRWQDLSNFCKLLINNEKVVLTGESGSGKTSFLKNFISCLKANKLKGFDKNHFLPIYVDQYDEPLQSNLGNIENQVKEWVNNEFSYKNDNINWKQLAENIAQKYSLTVIIMFDQFERIFYLSREKQEALLKEIKNLINKTSKVKVIMSLRKDWYADLNKFSYLDISNKNTFFLENLNKKQAGSFWNKAFKIAKIAGFLAPPEDLCEHILDDLMDRATEKILPAELAVIGIMILSLKITTKEEYDIKGKDGLVEEFLDQIVLGTGKKNIVWPILFSLSTQQTYRQPITIDTIASITQLDENDIKNVIKNLRTKKIVNEAKPGAYELIHDYLAKIIYNTAPKQLNTYERDNIAYLLKILTKERATDDSKFIRIKDLPLLNYQSKDCFYMLFVFLILVVGLIVRLFWPNAPILQGILQEKIKVFELFLPVFMQKWLKSLSYPVGSSGPDWHFIPTALIGFICVYYAYVFYVRLGILLGQQSKLVNHFLRFMLGFYPIMAFLIIFHPYSWALVATLGGFYITFIYCLILKCGIKYIAFQDLIKSKLYLTLFGTLLYLAAFDIILKSPPEFKFACSLRCALIASFGMYLAIKPLHGHDIKILIGVLNRGKREVS